MTGIQSTDETWIPYDRMRQGVARLWPAEVRGCDDTGGCYAMAMANAAFEGSMGQAKYQNDGDPLQSGPGFGVTLHPDGPTCPAVEALAVFVNRCPTCSTTPCQTTTSSRSST